MRAALVVAAALCAGGMARAQDVPAKVDEYMTAGMKAGQFSAVILVARQGQVLISRGYGMANYEHDVPLTPQTKFRIASTTKPLTATAVLMLQDQGKLAVADPICRYLAPCPKGWEPITIHHLLSHTSGVPDIINFPEFDAISAAPQRPADLVRLIAEKPLEFVPGERFAYSNSGFMLLGAIIERVSGVSYAAFMQKSIFDALDMRSSGYDDPALLLKQRANGYVRRPAGLENAPDVNMTIPFAAGGLYSTVEDLYSWDQAMHGGQLLTAKSSQAMMTAVRNNYGYGMMLREEFGRRHVGHTGTIDGFTSFMVRYPAEQVTIIVLSNIGTTSAAAIGRDLAAIVFGQPYEVIAERKEVAIDPAILDAYIGEYERAPGRNLIVTKRDGKLFLDFVNRPTVQLLPESNVKFFVRQINAQFEFVKDESGRVTHLILYQQGESIQVRKVK
jgi:CubicO group peptidase (beta-lactamase class C family)